MILFAHVILAIMILTLTGYFRTYQPDKVNRIFGYRTSFSMKNQETWKEANQFSSRLQFKFALFFTVFTLFSYFLIGGITSFYLSCAFLTVISIAVIPLTEYHLRKKFDHQGKPVTKP